MKLSAEQIDALHSAALVPEDGVVDRLHSARRRNNPAELKTPEALETLPNSLVGLLQVY